MERLYLRLFALIIALLGRGIAVSTMRVIDLGPQEQQEYALGFEDGLRDGREKGTLECSVYRTREVEPIGSLLNQSYKDGYADGFKQGFEERCHP